MTRADVCSRCLVLALLSMLPAAASGASYRFVVLADSAAGARPLSAMPPSIDENGAVAFVTSEDGFEGMLLVASWPGAGTSADYTTVHAGLRLHAGRTQIGRFGAGRLAYWDDTFPRSTIYRWAGGAPVPVDTVVGIQDAPAMSDLGEIAFFDEDDEVVATDGVEKSVIARRDLEFADGEVIDNLNRPAPDMDGAGRVAYFASLETAEPTCDDRILLSGADPPLVIASGGVLRTDCPFGNLLATVPIAVNDAASAAYAGDFWTPQDPFVDAVFVDETVVWDRRFAGFEDVAGLPVVAVALNDAGLVSFLLEFSGAIGRKLYVGPDPVDDHVIGRGDALCGGVVDDVDFHRFGLNDAGALAFGVRLVGDRHLIVRAEPTLTEPGACVMAVPEPALGEGAAGAALALLAIGGASRARVARGGRARRARLRPLS